MFIIFIFMALKQKRVFKSIPQDMPNIIQLEKQERENILKLKSEREVNKNEEDKEEDSDGEEEDSDDDQGESVRRNDLGSASTGLPPLPARDPDEIRRHNEIQGISNEPTEPRRSGTLKNKGSRKSNWFTPI